MSNDDWGMARISSAALLDADFLANGSCFSEAVRRRIEARRQYKAFVTSLKLMGNEIRAAHMIPSHLLHGRPMQGRTKHESVLRTIRPRQLRSA